MTKFTASMPHYCIAAFALCALAAVPQTAAAQNFGVKGGANDATLIFKSTKPPIGPWWRGAGGIFGTRNLWSIVGIEAEVLVSAKGAKATTSTGSSIDFVYLSVPVLARLKVLGASAVRIHLVGGVEPAYRLTAKLVSGGSSIDYKEFIRTFDNNGVVGADAEFGRFMLDVRYTRSFRNIATSIAQADFRNRTVTALVGYALK